MPLAILPPPAPPHIQGSGLTPYSAGKKRSHEQISGFQPSLAEKRIRTANPVDHYFLPNVNAEQHLVPLLEVPAFPNRALGNLSKVSITISRLSPTGYRTCSDCWPRRTIPSVGPRAGPLTAQYPFRVGFGHIRIPHQVLTDLNRLE